MRIDSKMRHLLGLIAVTTCIVGVAPPAGADPTITAAGDIAQGDAPSQSQTRTARLIRRLDPTRVLTLGDNQYPDGELSDFRASYDPTWGRFRGITHPSAGNHDYHIEGADGYFDYFGRRAHRQHGGYYSFDIGRWHLIAVNTGASPPSDEQLAWIRRDLRRNNDLCELAYWHHPRWSSGTTHGSDSNIGPLWRVLFRAGVDVALNGHEHNYERFAPLNPRGRRAPRTGIREFVVGTGGADPYPFGGPIAGSQRRITGKYGVLEVTLHRAGYEWAFVKVNDAIADSGRSACHR